MQCSLRLVTTMLKKAIVKVVFFTGGFLSLFSIVLILIFGENLITLFTKENNQEFKTFAYTALMLFAFNYFLHGLMF